MSVGSELGREQIEQVGESGWQHRGRSVYAVLGERPGMMKPEGWGAQSVRTASPCGEMSHGVGLGPLHLVDELREGTSTRRRTGLVTSRRRMWRRPRPTRLWRSVLQLRRVRMTARGISPCMRMRFWPCVGRASIFRLKVLSSTNERPCAWMHRSRRSVRVWCGLTHQTDSSSSSSTNSWSAVVR